MCQCTCERKQWTNDVISLGPHYKKDVQKENVYELL